MTINNDLLERYRAARTMFNTSNEQQETLYHQRQRKTLEDLRSTAYKYALVQSKRREWCKSERNFTHRPVRLSMDIRRTFQVDKSEQSPSLSDPSLSMAVLTLPPRIYPSPFHLRQVTSKQSMTMTVLHQLIFLGQFDRKFLIGKRCIRSSDSQQIQLILFDQHAISERILLEHLQRHFEKETIRITPFQLPEPALITRNARFLYTSDQISLLEHIGFIFSSISMHHLLVRSVPAWLLSLGQRHRSSTSLLDDLISQTIDHILSNSTPNIQLLIYETLKSLACHNAIKFNDILSSSECKQLLQELKSCSMPFICAHGRTSAAILWEYDIPSEYSPIDFTELKSQASIHKWLKYSS